MDGATSPSPSSNSSFAAPSPKESPRFDPYAFTVDEHISPHAKGASNYHSSGLLHLSVHPKTFMPPGNPFPNMRSLPEKAAEPLVAHFPLHLHSPTQGIVSHHVMHSSTKLETDTAVLAGDNKRHAVTQSHFQNIPFSGPSVVYHNGGVASQTEGKMVTPKKKKKSKALTVAAGVDGSKKTTKSKKLKETISTTLVSMQTQASIDSFHMGTGFQGQPHMGFERKGGNTQVTFSTSLVKDGALVHSLQGKGNIPLSPSQPTTISTSTFTNSIRFIPDDRRHSNDSFEHSGSSRPASRTSTTSSTSTDGKPKETNDTISLSKILEIIEREKSLGSSSPCKRRRTAKPQHIQEAEEEAKKYAATNTVQGCSPGADNLSTKKKQESKTSTSAKKNLSSISLSPSEICSQQSLVGAQAPDTVFHTEASHLSNDSSDGRSSQILQTFPEHSNLSTLSNSASSSPVHNKSFHPQSFNSSLLNNGLKPEQSPFSELKILPSSSSIFSQTVTPANHVEKSSQVSQLFNPLTPIRSISQATSRPVEVKESVLTSPLLNTQVTCHPTPHATGIPQIGQKPPESPSAVHVSPTFERTLHEHRTPITPQSPSKLLSSSPISISGNLSAIQRTSFQGLFPESPALSAQWAGEPEIVQPSAQSTMPTHDSLMDVKVQDLEPSLTCDLNNSWSQTADIISGNNTMLHPSNPFLNILSKKIKKKRPTNKPKISQLSLQPQQSEGEFSIDTLPSFDAFAGLKTEPLSFDIATNGAHQINPQCISEGLKCVVKKKKQKKPSVPCEDGNKEQKPIICCTVAQEPLRDNSNLKLANGLMDKNELPVHSDSYKTAKPAGASNIHDLKSVIDSSTNVAQFPGHAGRDSKQCSGVGMKYGSNSFVQNSAVANKNVTSTFNPIQGDTGSTKQPIMASIVVGSRHCVNGLTVKSPTSNISGRDCSIKAPISPCSPQNTGCYRKPQAQQGSVKSTSHRNSADLQLPFSPIPLDDKFGIKPKSDVSFFLNGVMPSNNTSLTSPKGSPTKASPPLPKLEFMSPEEELDDRLHTNRVETAPNCGCLGPNYEFNESIEGPYYTQLGTARDMVELRTMMEKRVGVTGKALRLEKIHYTGKEGCSKEGCPIAKWIIRRSGLEEKYLCIARKRPGHFCSSAYIVVVIVAIFGERPH